MIINIRGTSGSGKSTLIRSIMALYETCEPVKAEGRKQPLLYVCKRALQPPLSVLGHYETDCGGCDTINGLDLIFELADRQAREGHDVLFEGLLISAEYNRTKKILDEHPGWVVHLDLPLQECLDSVNGRRRAKAERTGKPEPSGVNPKNTESKWKGTRSTAAKLRSVGVNVFAGGRDECLAFVRTKLGI